MSQPTIELLQAEIATLKAEMADVLNWHAGARLQGVDLNLGQIEDRLTALERKLGVKP